MTGVAECQTRGLIFFDIFVIEGSPIHKLEQDCFIDDSRNWSVKMLESLALAPFAATDKVILPLCTRTLLTTRDVRNYSQL